MLDLPGIHIFRTKTDELTASLSPGELVLAICKSIGELQIRFVSYKHKTYLCPKAMYGT